MVSCFQHSLDAKVFFLETHSLPFAKVTQLPPAEQAHRPASLASSRHGDMVHRALMSPPYRKKKTTTTAHPSPSSPLQESNKHSHVEN